MGKILLFYKYVHIQSPKRVMKWLKKVCGDLCFKGRILLANEGINGTLGGSQENTERFKKIMEEHPLFGTIDYKESAGSADCFPRMQITVRDTVVNLGVDPQELTSQEGGKHLTPDEVHALIKQNPDDLVILDTRNDYEWKVGHFKGAIKPDIKHFRDFPEYVDKHLDEYKDKQVLMYCTGGIRCERATAYLNKKGITKQVYQIKGGIHRYAEKYPDGFFRGKNYVFDGRVAVKINDDILGECGICTAKCDDYINCLNAKCNKHFICCTSCKQEFVGTCSEQCKQLVTENKVKTRPEFKKTSACNINK